MLEKDTFENKNNLSALTNCLLIEAKAIANTATKLDKDQVEATLNLLKTCLKNRGKLTSLN